MSVASESASHSTLLTASSELDLQSDNLEARVDSPFPQKMTLYETLNPTICTRLGKYTYCH